MEANYCQCGIICDGCCLTCCCCQGCTDDCCTVVTFNVKNAAGEVVGEMKKIRDAVTQLLMGDDDDYYLKFPEASTGEERALLVAAIIMMDYCFFDVSSVAPVNVQMNYTQMNQMNPGQRAY